MSKNKTVSNKLETTTLTITTTDSLSIGNQNVISSKLINSNETDNKDVIEEEDNTTTDSVNENNNDAITPKIDTNYNISSDNDSSETFSETLLNTNDSKIDSQDYKPITTNEPIVEPSPPNSTSNFNENSTSIELITSPDELILEKSLNNSDDIPPTKSTKILTTPTLTTHKNDRFNFDIDQDLSLCYLDGNINCNHNDLVCYGAGSIDCGDKDNNNLYKNLIKRSERSPKNRNERSPKNRNERSPKNQSDHEKFDDEEFYRLTLESNSPSDSIKSLKCSITPFMKCYPTPLLKDCQGKAICKPAPSSEIHSPMQFWKVGLISGLTAGGGLVFIIVAIVGFVS